MHSISVINPLLQLCQLEYKPMQALYVNIGTVLPDIGTSFGAALGLVSSIYLSLCLYISLCVSLSLSVYVYYA